MTALNSHQSWRYLGSPGISSFICYLLLHVHFPHSVSALTQPFGNFQHADHSRMILFNVSEKQVRGNEQNVFIDFNGMNSEGRSEKVIYDLEILMVGKYS